MQERSRFDPRGDNRFIKGTASRYFRDAIV